LPESDPINKVQILLDDDERAPIPIIDLLDEVLQILVLAILMLTLRLQALRALVGCHVLDEAQLVAVAWDVLQDLLESEKFVFYSVEDVVAINRAEDHVSLLCMGAETLFKVMHALYVCLVPHYLCDLIKVNANMAHTEGHEAPVVLKAEDAALAERLSQIEQSRCPRVEIACILKHMEGNQICTQQRLHDLEALRQHLVNVSGRPR